MVPERKRIKEESRNNANTVISIIASIKQLTSVIIDVIYSIINDPSELIYPFLYNASKLNAIINVWS